MRSKNYFPFYRLITVLFLGLVMILLACHKSEDGTVTVQNSNSIVLSDGSAFSEILGRPTNTTISVNILFAQQAEVYWEYGTTSGNYSGKTATSTVSKDVPLEADLTNLTTDTKYFYRTRYRLNGSSSFLAGPENTFHTPRSSGSSFTFAIEADPHLDTNSDSTSYKLTLNNITVYTNDSSNNVNSSSIRFYTDSIAPSINFTYPTLENNSNISANSIYVNYTVNDSNPSYSFINFDHSLVGWWRMDNINSSGDPTDLSGYGNNGSAKNGTVQTTAA